MRNEIVFTHPIEKAYAEACAYLQTGNIAKARETLAPHFTDRKINHYKTFSPLGTLHAAALYLASDSEKHSVDQVRQKTRHLLTKGRDRLMMLLENHAGISQDIPMFSLTTCALAGVKAKGRGSRTTILTTSLRH